MGNGETGRLPGCSIVLQTRAYNDNDDETRYNIVSLSLSLSLSLYMVAQRRRNLPLKGMFAQGKFALPFSVADEHLLVEIYFGMRLRSKTSTRELKFVQ